MVYFRFLKNVCNILCNSPTQQQQQSVFRMVDSLPCTNTHSTGGILIDMYTITKKRTTQVFLYVSLSLSRSFILTILCYTFACRQNFSFFTNIPLSPMRISSRKETESEKITRFNANNSNHWTEHVIFIFRYKRPNYSSEWNAIKPLASNTQSMSMEAMAFLWFGYFSGVNDCLAVVEMVTIMLTLIASWFQVCLQCQ